MKKSLVLLSMVVLSSVGYAETQPFHFGTSAGYYQFANKQKIDSSTFPSVSAGVLLSDTASLEVSYGHIVSNSTDSAAKPGVSGDLYNVDIINTLPYKARLQPFTLIGFGVNHFDNPDSNDASVLANANAGFGVTYPLEENLALRADIHDQYTFIGGKNDIISMLGLQFSFGTPPAASADSASDEAPVTKSNLKG